MDVRTKSAFVCEGGYSLVDPFLFGRLLRALCVSARHNSRFHTRLCEASAEQGRGAEHAEKNYYLFNNKFS